MNNILNLPRMFPLLGHFVICKTEKSAYQKLINVRHFRLDAYHSTPTSYRTLSVTTFQKRTNFACACIMELAHWWGHCVKCCGQHTLSPIRCGVILNSRWRRHKCFVIVSFLFFSKYEQSMCHRECVIDGAPDVRGMGRKSTGSVDALKRRRQVLASLGLQWASCVRKTETGTTLQQA